MIVSNQAVQDAIIERLNRPLEAWQLVSIFNTIANCAALDNKGGDTIHCDDEEDLEL
jgi:hypothetical protein